MGFTKLDESILMSSIMLEDSDTFKVWIALLAACKSDGIARVSIVGIASHTFLPIETVRRSFEKLSSPDIDSRSINDEGKRIRRIDGGYEIINYQKYRELSYKEAEAERKWKKRNCPDMSGNVQGLPDHSASASVLLSSDSGIQDKGNTVPVLERHAEFLRSGPDRWMAFDYQSGQAWASLFRDRPNLDPDGVIAAAKEYREYCQACDIKPEYIKRPDNWLRQGDWTTDWSEQAKKQKKGTTADEVVALIKAKGYEKYAK
jgi:hypothetical protein